MRVAWSGDDHFATPGEKQNFQRVKVSGGCRRRRVPQLSLDYCVAARRRYYRDERPPSQRWRFAMTAIQSKSALLYREVRCALRSGRYVPGQRIDPATIAEEFHASATPVRFALYRLVGEGLIADHARSGLYVPLPNEEIGRAHV